MCKKIIAAPCLLISDLSAKTGLATILDIRISIEGDIFLHVYVDEQNIVDEDHLACLASACGVPYDKVAMEPAGEKLVKVTVTGSHFDFSRHFDEDEGCCGGCCGCDEEDEDVVE